MDVNQLKRIYFVGVGGIGMSALARFFKQRHAHVSGYDLTETDLTRQLAAEGIEIIYRDEVGLVDKEAELVVYTPAIPQSNEILNWYRDHNYPVYKRSDVLQWITESFLSVTVAGTHGKTTISTMTAYLLREAGQGCNAFLGGISVNYQSNYWSSENDVAVIEADEYDRSFLKLHPDIAILTAMDADHLDIYGTVDAMEEAFIQYTRNIKPGGTLIVKHGLHRGSELTASRVISYSLQNDAADVYAANIVQKSGEYIFDVIGKEWTIPQVHLPQGGMHNVENAVAAIIVAMLQGLDPVQIKHALAGFKGVKRRFEYVLKTDKVVFIDDYAHHPEELAALIKSAKRLFPGRKCVIAFQPHLFSRTKDLAAGFAASLDMADEVLLLDIYPARETPVAGITSQLIADQMTNPVHTILTKEGLLQYAATAKPQLFITAGAGDIDKLVAPIKERLEQQ